MRKKKNTNIPIAKTFLTKNEINSVVKPLNSGWLVQGQYVQEFENKFSKYFSVKHSISVNSWTSGLITAIGAIGIEPGDEVILSPWTMSACAASILHYGGIPIFADIDEKTFNIDPNSIIKKITDKTKALIVIDIFGHPADYNKIFKISKKHKLRVISDSAQSIGSKYKGKYTGTFSDIGGFSFNCHKHINTGEGGMLVTNNSILAKKMKLIRNHAEAVLKNSKIKDYSNMIGYNFRMGEMEAAVGIEQLKKLKNIIKKKRMLAKKLTDGLSKLKGINTPYVNKNCTHVYYVYGITLNSKIINVSRDKIYKALIKEGVPCRKDYELLYLYPLFKKKISYGNNQFPWNINSKIKSYKYFKGMCPNAEKILKNYIGIGFCIYDFTPNDISLIIKAFRNVWKKFKII